MGKILVTYDSGYGATADAAKTIAKILNRRNWHVDLGLVGKEDPFGYDAVCIGSPIRFGRCTPKTRNFLKRHRSVLARMPVAVFFTCMSVTSDVQKADWPLFIDPGFNRPNRPRARIKMMQNNHTASHYLRRFLRSMPDVSPVGVAFFLGRLDLGQLSFVHRLIMRLAMFALPDIKNGDFLNDRVVANWAGTLANQLNSG